MTAKEMLTNLFNVDFLNESEIETIAKAMDMYAKGKCKEQRVLCMNEILDEKIIGYFDLTDDMRKNVLNAPEPEFETLKMKVNENY